MSHFLFFLDAVSQVSVLHCHRAFLAFFFSFFFALATTLNKLAVSLPRRAMPPGVLGGRRNTAGVWEQACQQRAEGKWENIPLNM